MSTHKTTCTRQDNAKTLARLISLFPEEGVDKWVLQHLWTDCPRYPDEIARALTVFTGNAATPFLREYWTDHPLLPECADRGGLAGFRSALSELARQNVIRLEKGGSFVRMDGNTRSALWKEMGQDGQYLAATVSDFLAAWLGFSPFPHEVHRLRHFAETSLLGRGLAKEIDRFNRIRSNRIRRLRFQSIETAMANVANFHPDGRHSPLVWAEFLERGDRVVFPNGLDPFWVRLSLRRFLRYHWVYAFQNRGHGPMVNALFDDVIGNWNFFDCLVSLRNHAAPADRILSAHPEWREEIEDIFKAEQESE